MGYFTGVTDPAESLDVNLPHEILGLSSCTLCLSAVSRMIGTYEFLHLVNPLYLQYQERSEPILSDLFELGVAQMKNRSSTCGKPGD